MRKFYILIYLSIGAIFICGVALNIIVSNHYVGSGNELTILDDKIATLSLKNQILTQQIASASGYTTIESKATQLGFVERNSQQLVTFTNSQLPVALANHQ